MESIQLRVLVSQNKKTGTYLARCLENNLVAQADSLQKVQERLLATLHCHIDYDKQRNREIFYGRKKAPEVYENLFKSAKKRPFLSEEDFNAELAFI